MADIICRWRNATAKTVCQFVSVLPKEQMSSERFRDIMDKQTLFPDYFRTAYQLACQLGLYCEENGVYTPRFTRDIDENEANTYLSHWIRWYYAPNPFTKSLKASDTPKYLVSELLHYVEKNGPSPIREALESIYDDQMGNLDIVTNAINNFSHILKIENQIVSLTDNCMDYMNDMPNRNDRDLFFKNFDNQNESLDHRLLDDSLQLIYFGAPGTGKSHRIKQACKKYEHYRITFHPDTDYASFVGSYKPITHKEQVYTNMGDKAIPLKDAETGKPVTTTRITYQYVYQAFLNAYIAAWREQQNEEPKPVYLVIEEINRGNCAQIFGDIFQLLDRNDYGFSDYPIVADNDLKKELAREFADLEVVNADTINGIYDDDMVAKVKIGSHLLLPDNLHIWATMNTSDQSLFPIDSAFKRRWEWKYVKIADSGLSYRIAVNGNEYDWWEFVKAVNAKIGTDTDQEDKKLGYFFAKAKKNAVGNFIISADTLLSKVLFFIYNDVYKDFGLDDAIFQDENDETMTFAGYFDRMGDTVESRVERFILNLGLSPLSRDETVVDEEAPGNDADYKTIKVNVNGEQKTTMTTAMIAILEDAARSHSMDEIESAVKEYITRGDDPIIKRVDNPDTYTKENRWNKTIIRSSDGVAFVVTTMWLRRFLPMIEKLAEHFNVPFEVVNP